MQEFNKVTTTSNFIKNLLRATYLPLIRTVRGGDYIVEGRMYILHCNIIKCTKSGYIIEWVATHHHEDIAQYELLDEYTFGDRNDKLCTNFLSNCEGYDYRTHERLGQYLRNLRDMYGLNLMPLYNCFSNQPLEAHHIYKDRVTQTTEYFNTKVYKVPIRFNQKYTICIENPGVTTFAPAFVNGNSRVKINNSRWGNGIDATNRYITLHRGDVIRHQSGMRYREPYVIHFDNIPQTKSYPITKLENIERYTELNFGGSDAWKLKDKYFTQHIANGGETLQNVYTFENSVMVAKTTLTPSRGSIYYTQNASPKDSGWKSIVFSTVSSPSGSPKDNGYYEVVNGDYVISSSNSIVDGVTYYTLDSISDSNDEYILTNKVYYVQSSEEVVTNITYDIEEEVCQVFDPIEKNLHLLIQVPSSFNSNILVLEGDYTEANGSLHKSGGMNFGTSYDLEGRTDLITPYNDTYHIVETTELELLPQSVMDYICTENLKLMTASTTKIIPFSDTLVEFLLWNAIDNLDTINNDMDRISTVLKYNTEFIISGTTNKQITNYWHSRWQKYISDFASKYPKYIQDNLGYITKDIEEIAYKQGE